MQCLAKHFDPSSTAVPVTNDTTIRIVLLLMLLADWSARIHDVKGAFLNADFEDSEENFMEVPKVWNTTIGIWQSQGYLSHIYGLKQAAL